MTDRELMQQALEALEMWCKGPHDSATRRGANTRSSVAITALRDRLAQHEALDQLIADSQSMGAYSLDQVKAVLRQDDPQFDERMEKARERLAQPEQEPVAWLMSNGTILNETSHPHMHTPLYTTPPRREWQGLTEEEVDECYYWKGRQWTTDELVRHVEAKLKEKNA